MKTHNRKNIIIAALLLSLTALLTSCANTTVSNIPAVTNFDKEKYLGRWYEIARTDNRFQRGLSSSFATYSANDNGTIKVVNRGYNDKDNTWEIATGKAKFVGAETSGRLKVSFFGPFYGAYNVVAIDAEYQHVLVMGNDSEYMWILSREKTIPEPIKANYIAKAKEYGVNIDTLIWDTQQQTFKEKIMTTIYDFSAKDIRGNDIHFKDFQDKVILVVNTASNCGFTSQYDGLEKLYETYKEKGLVIIGFPCNQFGGQEPGSEEEIADFCRINYGVSFPMMKKIDVNGDNAHPLYQWLKSQKGGLLGSRIKWNFTKFLIGRDGQVIDRFAPTTKPKALAKAIEKAL